MGLLFLSFTDQSFPGFAIFGLIPCFWGKPFLGIPWMMPVLFSEPDQ